MRPEETPERKLLDFKMDIRGIEAHVQAVHKSGKKDSRRARHGPGDTNVKKKR
jgi:hypothetical protein